MSKIIFYKKIGITFVAGAKILLVSARFGLFGDNDINLNEKKLTLENYKKNNCLFGEYITVKYYDSEYNSTCGKTYYSIRPFKLHGLNTNMKGDIDYLQNNTRDKIEKLKNVEDTVSIIISTLENSVIEKTTNDENRKNNRSMKNEVEECEEWNRKV